MQKVFFLSLLLILSSCSGVPGYDQKCIIKKLTFDIGSGSTKYYYAQVNQCAHTLKHIYDEGQIRFPFKQYLINSKNNSFSDNVQNEFIKKVTNLIKKHPSDLIEGVATSAFRTSNNGQQFKDKIAKQTGMKLKIISQKAEGFLGLKGVQFKKMLHGKFLYWDIGGGSMQMITMDNNAPLLYEGKIGAASFKDLILKSIFQNQRKSPNPLLVKNIDKAINLAKNFAKKTISTQFYKTVRKLPVVGIGGVHQFAILQKNSTKDYYTQQDLKNWIKKGATKNDQQVGGKFSQTDITNIALVLGYMQYLQLPRVDVVKGVNMAYALLNNWGPVEDL